MIIFFAITAILILTYSLLTVPYVTIDIDCSSDRLVVWIYAWFIKRKFVVDLSDKAEDKKPQDKKPQEENLSDKDLQTADTKAEKTKNAAKAETVETDAESDEMSIKNRLKRLKDRVFSEEKGFDTDEAKAVLAETKEKFSFVWALARRFFSAMRYKIKIPVWRITLDFGTDNAAATGMLYGSVWGAIGMVYPLLARYAYVVYPLVDITPDFYGKRFNIKMKSIIKVRPVHIINAAVPPLLTYLKEYLKNASKQSKNDKK